MHVFNGDSAFWLALLIIILAVLIAALPTLVAVIRGAEDTALIVLFNAIGCVTLLGWPVALVLAIKAPRRRDLRPARNRPSQPVRR